MPLAPDPCCCPETALAFQEQIVEMLRTMDMLKKDVSEKDKALRTANEALRSSEKQAEEVIGICRA